MTPITVHPPKPTPLTWSDQQQAIFTHAATAPGSFNVVARAGCSKTTVLVELAKRVPGKVFLGAFNKSIADELSARVASNPRATTTTLHSLGLRLWKETHPKCEIDSRKVSTLARELYPWDKKLREIVADAVGFAKQAGFGIPPSTAPMPVPEVGDEVAWGELLEAYDLVEEIPEGTTVERVVRDCVRVYQRSLDMCVETLSRLDFNDMIIAPLVFGTWKPQRFDWVMVDEGQDLSMTKYMLSALVLKTSGRFVLVGDPAQSIYAFSGARVGIMDVIGNINNAVELPLSITYRCPKSIVSMAQQWVPEFTAHTTAPDGQISTIHHTDLWFQQFDAANDVILCRNTRPLVGIAQRLRGMGVACIVEGANGKGIIALATKWGDIEIRELLLRVAEYQEREVAKWVVKGNEEKAERVVERCGIVLSMARDMDETLPVRRLVAKLESMFGEGEQAANVLRLCTIHRSKGREWGRVFLVGRNRYQPSKFAVSEEDRQQEQNLEYVAVTRVKRELVEVVVPVPQGGRREECDWWEV